MIKIVNRSLFDSDCDFICHQCNCKSNIAHGLAADLFDIFPYSNVYDHDNRVPGTIEIRGNGKDQRYIVAIYAQVYPGKSPHILGKDGVKARKEYFINGLKEILKCGIEFKSVAFPWKIGRGLAGEDWENIYLPILEKFEKVLKRESKEVFLYKI